MKYLVAALAVCALWISGAWWDRERPVSVTTLLVAIFLAIFAASLSGCSTGKALFDACRDGLCR